MQKFHVTECRAKISSSAQRCAVSAAGYGQVWASAVVRAQKARLKGMHGGETFLASRAEGDPELATVQRKRLSSGLATTHHGQQFGRTSGRSPTTLLGRLTSLISSPSPSRLALSLPPFHPSRKSRPPDRCGYTHPTQCIAPFFSPQSPATEDKNFRPPPTRTIAA